MTTTTRITATAEAVAAPLLFDAREAAARLGISVRTIRTHTMTGLLPCHRVGGLVRYTPACLDAFLQATYDPGDVG